MDKNHLKHIQTLFDDATAQKKMAGVNLLIYKDGNEIGYFQSGYADINEKRLYDRNTICRMYSMTKPVTAVAALILVEEGKLDLSEELGNYLPCFWNLQVCYKGNDIRKSCRNILIQDLLNMTSGYTYGAWSDDSPIGEKMTSTLINELNQDVIGENKITTQQVAQRLAQIPVSFEPGTDYNYGLSADILGAVIEKVSGEKLSEFMKKRIFEPLGMSDTAFFVPFEKQPRLSKVYKSYDVKDEKGNVTGKELELFTNCNLGIQDKMDHAPAFESGGAGLCSTIDDYMKFALMLLNKGLFNGKRILQPKTVEFMQNCCLRDDLQQHFNQKMEHLSGYTYCNLVRVAFEPEKCKFITEKGEFGWDGWLGPYLSIDIKNQLAIVMTMQRTDSGTTDVTRKMKNIVYSSL